LTLQEQGFFVESLSHFVEALSHLERGHELGSKQPNWRSPSAQWVSDCRRLVELERKVLAILQGEASPRDAGECLALAEFCYKTGRHSTATRFAEEAFAEKPTLVDDLETGHRYNAACYAALAGSSQGRNEPMPDESTRIKFREKARVWLRNELAAWTKSLTGGDEKIRQSLVKEFDHWNVDLDLAGIRDEAALAKLPEAEREAFRKLWADVEALRVKAGGK
jgi:hypothetical protein